MNCGYTQQKKKKKKKGKRKKEIEKKGKSGICVVGSALSNGTMYAR
jgi:hypothetical protein